MKKLLLVVLIIFPVCLFSQAKKTIAKKTAATKPTEISIMTAKAKSWFKNVYVETSFKDPYSYKLMKMELIPVSAESAFENLVSDIERRLSDLDTSRFYSDYKTKLRKLEEEKRPKPYLTRDSSSQASHERYLTTLQSDINAELDRIKGLNKTLEECRSKLKSLTPAQRKKTFEYLVFVDAYGKNGYGNLVLNRYTFDMSTDGECSDVRERDF